MKQYFEAIKSALTPCTGDFLAGRTRQQVYNEMYPRDAFGEKVVSKDRVDAVIDARIEEFKQHKGEYRFLYRLNDPANTAGTTISIMKIWESEIDTLEGTVEFEGYSDSPSKMPIFRKK